MTNPDDDAAALGVFTRRARRPAEFDVRLGGLAGFETPPASVAAAGVDSRQAPEPDDPEPVFRNVDVFVRTYLAHVVERRVAAGASAGFYWCPRWWAHPEGVSRLYCLWRAWESMRLSDPQTGMSRWWRDHFDPHFAALTGEHGPFHRCGPGRHVEPQPLPVEPAPLEVLAQFLDEVD